MAMIDIDYLKILIAPMTPKTPIMTMLIIDGNDVDYLNHTALGPGGEGARLGGGKILRQSRLEISVGEIWIISKYQS